MELNLSMETVKYYKTVLNKDVSHEETMEMIVPDAQPDISKIIDADGVIMLRGKEAVSGKVSVSGLVNGYVLYSPEGGNSVQKLEFSLPFAVSAENAQITQETEIRVRLLLTNCDAKTVNPRKLIIRANIDVCMECLHETELKLSNGIDNANEASIETLCRDERAVPIHAVAEKRFVVSDEYKLPSAKPALDEILSNNVRIVCEDVKTVGNKLIVKGTAYVSILYSGKENSGVVSAEFQSVFSQILELDFKCDDADFDVDIVITGVYLNVDDYNAAGEQCLMTEVHAVAQCKANVPMNLNYLMDLYSTKYELDVARENFELTSFEGRETVTEVFRDTIPLTDPVKTVLGSTVRIGSVESSPGEGGEKLAATAYVTVIYISENGMLVSVAKKIPLVLDYENLDRMLYATAVYSGDIYLTMTSDGIEVRFSVDFTIVKYRMVDDNAVNSVSFNETKMTDNSDKPSLIVRHMEYGDTLWDLAKRYSSTRELITSANGAENDADITEGMLLIIPKKR